MVNTVENTTRIKGTPSNRSLAIIFSVLVAIIVGLTVGIIYTNVNQAEEDVNLTETEEIITPNDAGSFADEIAFRYDEDENYLIEDAYHDFEEGIESLDGNDKANLAIEYATFCYEYNNDLSSALRILESVKNLINDEETELSYYYTYIDMYEDMGDDKTASIYQNIIAEKYPDIVDRYDIAKQKEIEYENGNE